MSSLSWGLKGQILIAHDSWYIQSLNQVFVLGACDELQHQLLKRPAQKANPKP